MSRLTFIIICLFLLEGRQSKSGARGERVLPYKSDRSARRKFDNTPKRHQNLVLWACPKLISTPKRYQFINYKSVYNWHCKF